MDEEPTLMGFSGGERSQSRLGETLRAAREDQGLGLEEIAEQTRVPLRHLQAIERDDHDALPALPYTIGFVKTLARAIGVDPDAAAAQYRAETSKVPHVPQVVQLEPVDESRVPPRWLVAAVLALIVAIIAGVWAYGEGYFASAPQTPPEAAIAEAQPVTPQVAEQAPPAPLPEDATAPPAENSDTPGGVVAPETAPADTPSDSASAPAPVDGPVVITATDEVWFKVYDKGTRQSVKMGILKAGERYVVPGDRDDLLLWTGKAGALRLSVNGKTLPPLGGPEQMVKDVALTPAALLARAGG